MHVRQSLNNLCHAVMQKQKQMWSRSECDEFNRQHFAVRACNFGVYNTTLQVRASGLALHTFHALGEVITTR